MSSLPAPPVIVSLPGPPMRVALRVTVCTSIVSFPVDPNTYTRLAQAAGMVLKSWPLYWIITPGHDQPAAGQFGHGQLVVPDRPGDRQGAAGQGGDGRNSPGLQVRHLEVGLANEGTAGLRSRE